MLTALALKIVLIELVFIVPVLIPQVLIALVLLALVLFACVAQKLAPAKKNSRDLSPVSPTFCIPGSSFNQCTWWCSRFDIVVSIYEILPIIHQFKFSNTRWRFIKISSFNSSKCVWSCFWQYLVIKIAWLESTLVNYLQYCVRGFTRHTRKPLPNCNANK